jgi:hypothetical protein
MTQPFREIAELQMLLDALCEQTITPEQMQRLEELLLRHPEAEAYYVQYMSLYADLARHFAILPATTEQALRERLTAPRVEEEQKQPAPAGSATLPLRAARWPRLLVGSSLALSGLAAGLLLALTLWQRPSLPVVPEANAEPLDHTIALLLQAPGAKWGESNLPTRAGAPLLPGRLVLKSGFAHIQFYSGATVILQGPADFQLLSRNEAYCTYGKLRATVPPQAQGFTIHSPRFEVVDRGTEFGLDVDAGGKTEVHVFEGKVDLYDPGTGRTAAPRKELTTGHGLRLEGPDNISTIESNSAAFTTAEQLAQRALREAQRRQRNWLAASLELRQDPSLLVYFPFQDEPAGSLTLLDQAGKREKPHDGVIVGCSWVTGRWAGRQGLEFKRLSDRVRFHVPGEFQSLTLMAWVRIDALPNQNNSLMMTDGWEEGEPHWQIGDSGTVILGVQTRPKKGAHYHAPAVLTPERLGQWMHLAVVYDGAAGWVTHHVDGRPAHQEPVQSAIPLRIGNAEIGNWNVATHRNNTPIRYLNGCMDEFLMFSRALSSQEIEQFCDRGRPAL